MKTMPFVRQLTIAAVSLVAVIPAAHAEYGFRCGKPKKTGNVTVTVLVKPTPSARATPISITLHIDSTMTAEDKATAFWVAFVATKGDTVDAAHPDHLGRMTFTGHGSWIATGAGIDNDESDEPDTTLCSATPSDQTALCSLHGTASGQAFGGSQGSFAITISGRTVTVPTFPGMTATMVEQQVVGQLNGMGVQARFATPSDFADGLETLPHDSNVVVMQPSDMTGFWWNLSDTGLLMQLALLHDPGTAATSGVSSAPAQRGIELAAAPCPFSLDPVNVLYTAGRSDGPIDIAVFSAAGRRVRTLLTRGLAGSGSLRWDGLDDRGASVPGGVYFIRLSAGETSVTRKVVRVTE